MQVPQPAKQSPIRKHSLLILLRCSLALYPRDDPMRTGDKDNPAKRSLPHTTMRAPHAEADSELAITPATAP